VILPMRSAISSVNQNVRSARRELLIVRLLLDVVLIPYGKHLRREPVAAHHNPETFRTRPGTT
jgi:hypothetical protein